MRRFLEEGCTDKNECRYQSLDKQTTHAALATAKKVGRRKYGYMRNGEVTICGRMVILYKMIFDCKKIRAPPTAALERRAIVLQVYFARLAVITQREICKEMRAQKKELWEAQKRREAGCAE